MDPTPSDQDPDHSLSLPDLQESFDARPLTPQDKTRVDSILQTLYSGPYPEPQRLCIYNNEPVFASIEWDFDWGSVLLYIRGCASVSLHVLVDCSDQHTIYRAHGTGTDLTLILGTAFSHPDLMD